MTTKIGRADEQALLDASGTAFDNTPLPAAGATRRSEIVGLEPASQGRRTLGVSCRYVGGTSGTTGKPVIRVWVSCKDAVPADYTDASWRQIGVTDGIVTPAQAYAGGDSVQGQVLIQPDMVVLPAVAAAHVMAVLIPFVHGLGRWVYVEAAELGDTAHPGTLTLGIVHS